MKRFLDILIVLLLIPMALPLLIVIGILIKIDSKGPIFHWSDRVGKNNIIFKMPKFRSMYTETPQVATHLLKDSSTHITLIGKILRKTSLDELPQLYSILKGDMSLVGPRPALFNQDDLIELRTKNNVHTLLPGVTGWAQVCGRDEITIEKKVELDTEYLHSQSILFDFKIIVMTFYKVLKLQDVSH